ncbi:PIN-like domain-containing protein [Lysinibacillus sphaericus]|uniref:PIN-like domain-containing protein n=1 Tax=Lysinibacillus sphaericus TaxID=1421 RepID=UPI0004DF9BD0|nr:PIN-like domain-containing protein [Lysinibacillus sphaericus]QPA60710.1 hypothetical protein INQ55_10450 [Lysinibacillus sphaericus]
MKKLFAGFFQYNDDEFKEIWEKAIFVVDTNVLLSFFKYSTKETTTSLFKLLSDLKNDKRLLIPHHVALEFFHNFENVEYSQSEGINLLAKNLIDLKEEANTIFKRINSSHPYINSDNFKFVIEDLEQLNQKIQLKNQEELESLPDAEKLKNDLFDLIKGIIGEPYNQEKINAIEKDGKIRYQYNVPPGWKDRDDKQKQNFRTYGGIRYQQLYGDLIVWNQIIDFVKDEPENTKPIIFITEEKKEDWWEKNDGGLIKRPQPHLIQEFLEKTKQKFYMYRIDNFVKNASEYLGVEVTEKQMQDLTNQIEKIRESESEKDITDKGINVAGRILNYLSESEKEIFNKKLMSSYDSDFDGMGNYRYNEAYNWARDVALNNLEDIAHKLTRKLNFYSPEDADRLNNILYNLPIGKDRKLELLFYIIDNANELLEIKRSVINNFIKGY